MLNVFEFEKIVDMAMKGQISVGIERSFARKLFIEVPLRKIEGQINESLMLQKVISLIAFIGAPVLTLFSAIFFVCAFTWWSILGLPVLLIGCLFYKSLSVRGGAMLGFISWVSIIALATFFLNPPSIWSTPYLFLLPFIFGLWLERFLYCYTTNQLRGLVLRNKRAFELFQDAIDIRIINGNID